MHKLPQRDLGPWGPWASLAGHLALAALLAFLVLLPSPARADLVYRDSDGDSITIVGGPCPHDIVVRARQGLRGLYVGARASVGGRTFQACAALVMADGIDVPVVHVIVDQLGDDIFNFHEFLPDGAPPSAPRQRPGT